MIYDLKSLNIKKCLILLFLSISILIFNNQGFANTNTCWYNWDINDESVTLWDMLNKCKPDWVLSSKEETQIGTSPVGSVSVWVNEEWYELKHVKAKIYSITLKVIIFTYLVSIGGIVWWWYMLVGALGASDKIKKWKTAIQWSLIGFLIALLSQVLVNGVINLIYGIWGG